MRSIARQTRTPRSPRRQRGVSLLEVLIAVFVLAVGLLGTATLQLTSKRSNLEARDRATATMLAQSLVERMRVNPDELSTYTNAGAGRLLNGTVMAFQDCSAACTDQQIALHDLYQVEQALLGSSEQLGGQLVGGVSAPRVCIDGPAGGSGVYTVAIAWRGLTRLSNPTIHACGTGSGAYDASGGADPDAYRRVLAISTYIGVPA
jgi:type IV pilus assembly protein PilV